MSPLPPLEIEPLPGIDLRHFFVLTDGTAMLQHATRATPDLQHGYCTDDNARALIAAVKLWALPQETWASGEAGAFSTDDLRNAMQRYLAFLSYAFNDDAGRFRNFMQYDRTWVEQVGSEDSHARTIWALGKTVRLAPNDDIRQLADRLLLKALPAVEGFEHIRPWAYALLGTDEYLRYHGGRQLAKELRLAMAERLFAVWRENSLPDWPWWADELTWGNAKLPHAMLVAGFALERQEMVDASLKALRWLLEVQTGPAGQLSIIGNNGWFVRGRRRARFDQQPIEAKSLVQACLTAAAVTRDKHWAREAERCFEWFTGRNDVGLPLCNADTGGGYDGLGRNGVNANQGAESTLAYLLSVLELHLYDRARRGDHDLSPAPQLG